CSGRILGLELEDYTAETRSVGPSMVLGRGSAFWALASFRGRGRVRSGRGHCTRFLVSDRSTGANPLALSERLVLMRRDAPLKCWASTFISGHGTNTPIPRTPPLTHHRTEKANEILLDLLLN